MDSDGFDMTNMMKHPQKNGTRAGREFSMSRFIHDRTLSGTYYLNTTTTKSPSQIFGICGLNHFLPFITVPCQALCKTNKKFSIQVIDQNFWAVTSDDILQCHLIPIMEKSQKNDKLY